MEGIGHQERIFDSDPIDENDGPQHDSEQQGGSAQTSSEGGLSTGPAQPAEPMVAVEGPGSASAQGAQENLTSALDAFLAEMTTAPTPPLLQAPPPPPNSSCPPKGKKKAAATAADGPPRFSGRLAAKPDCGLPSMEKARLVLLRKQGICTEDEQATPDHIERYKQLYKSELPDNFIAAVTSLVATATSGKKKKARDEASGTGMAVALQA